MCIVCKIWAWFGCLFMALGLIDGWSTWCEVDWKWVDKWCVKKKVA